MLIIFLLKKKKDYDPNNDSFIQNIPYSPTISDSLLSNSHSFDLEEIINFDLVKKYIYIQFITKILF